MDLKRKKEDNELKGNEKFSSYESCQLGFCADFSLKHSNIGTPSQ